MGNEEMKTKDQIVKELRALQINTSTTQRALAKALNLPHSRVCEFLNGKRQINRATLERMGYDPTPYYKRRKT